MCRGVSLSVLRWSVSCLGCTDATGRPHIFSPSLPMTSASQLAFDCASNRYRTRASRQRSTPLNVANGLQIFSKHFVEALRGGCAKFDGYGVSATDQEQMGVLNPVATSVMFEGMIEAVFSSSLAWSQQPSVARQLRLASERKASLAHRSAGFTSLRLVVDSHSTCTQQYGQALSHVCWPTSLAIVSLNRSWQRRSTPNALRSSRLKSMLVTAPGALCISHRQKLPSTSQTLKTQHTSSWRQRTAATTKSTTTHAINHRRVVKAAEAECRIPIQLRRHAYYRLPLPTTLAMVTVSFLEQIGYAAIAMQGTRPKTWRRFA
mmetsp:Transcript_73007/g.200415  ORF Transcript_73007/g.200415 Transcript_73007/m.200415 type:complete len:319 (+) Transcript_73007:1427-2383(+)